MKSNYIFRPNSFFLISCFLLIGLKIYGQENSFIIKNVNIITMTTPNKIIQNTSVLIEENRIKEINNDIRSKHKIIDGKGKWLIPGLIDMHVHLSTDAYFGKKSPTKKPDITIQTQDVMTPFIANGVTTVLDLNATMETFGQKKEIEKGYVIGPRLALAALIDGGTGNGKRANSPEEGRHWVKMAKTEGYDCIKLYSHLSIETYKAIIDESNKQGLKTVGHIPDDFQGNLQDAFIPNFGLVAHAEEFSKHSDSFNIADADKFAKLAKANNTWVSPTLITMQCIANQFHTLDSIRNAPNLKYVHPLLQSKWLTANNYNKNTSEATAAYYDKMVMFHFQLVKALKDNAVPIVAGTDVGVSGVIAGFSLHDELDLLCKGGLTPEEALASATILSSQWLGIDKEIGTIEENKLADLILLDENPLLNIKNTRKIAAVIVNGKCLDKTQINKMMKDLATKNIKNKDKFDWNQLIKNVKK